MAARDVGRMMRPTTPAGEITAMSGFRPSLVPLSIVAVRKSGLAPPAMTYAAVPALSFEVRQRLNKLRPETLGQASRLSGVTPAAISPLLVHLKKGRFAGFESGPGRAT